MISKLQDNCGYKMPKLRWFTFWGSTALCLLILVPLVLYKITENGFSDIWASIGFTLAMTFVGFIWIGMSYVFLINKTKCNICKISVKDYDYCDRCNLQKEIELRNN